MNQPTAADRDRAEGRHAESGSRAAVLTAARELFAERGFNQVTVRDIAARANLSPAMVMKCGTKKELFYQAATVTPPPLPDVPRTQLGQVLVRELLERHQRDAIEQLTRALVLRLSAPDPEAVRERFLAGYVEPLAERLGGDDNARMHAELAISALSGLAASLRIFGLPSVQADIEEVADRYGRLVQALIDS